MGVADRQTVPAEIKKLHEKQSRKLPLFLKTLQN